MPEIEYEGEDNFAPSPETFPENFTKIGDLGLKNILGRSDVVVNKDLIPVLKTLDDILPTRNIKALVTSGYSQKHQSKCHTQYGSCIDIVPVSEESGCQIWQKLAGALASASMNTYQTQPKIIFETKIQAAVKGCVITNKDECGLEWKQCPKTTGPHIHVEFSR